MWELRAEWGSDWIRRHARDSFVGGGAVSAEGASGWRGPREQAREMGVARRKVTALRRFRRDLGLLGSSLHPGLYRRRQVRWKLGKE